MSPWRLIGWSIAAVSVCAALSAFAFLATMGAAFLQTVHHG